MIEIGKFIKSVNPHSNMALKVNFKISEGHDIKITERFALPGKGDWDWSNYVFFFHPKLKEKLAGVKTKKEKRRVIKSYVNDYYSKNKHSLERRKVLFKKEWREVNKKYVKIICKLLEINKKPKISATCFISICPICPRDLKSKEFSLFYKQKLKEARLTVAHEILHFYYFHKWKEVFPKSNEKNFDGPHIIWHLSEILAVVLLNSKELQGILKQKSGYYEEYRNIKINDLDIIDYFTKIYNKFKKRAFSNFLKEAYFEIKKHKRKITKI